VRGQQPLHRGPLRPDAAAVDEAHLPVPGLPCRVQVLVHHRHHVSWRERMQVDGVLDGYDYRIVRVIHFRSDSRLPTPDS